MYGAHRNVERDRGSVVTVGGRSTMIPRGRGEADTRASRGCEEQKLEQSELRVT